MKAIYKRNLLFLVSVGLVLQLGNGLKLSYLWAVGFIFLIFNLYLFYKNKRRNLVIGIAVAVIVFILFCVTTPFNKTEKTVCAPKEKSTLTLKVTMESKDGKVIKLTQEETTKLKKYNMTEKDFKTAAKEIKKGTKTYEGLSYTYEVKDGVGIETLTLDTDKASTDTYTLLGLTTKNDKDGKAVKVSTKKAIKSMENYGLECK